MEGGRTVVHMVVLLLPPLLLILLTAVQPRARGWGIPGTTWYLPTCLPANAPLLASACFPLSLLCMHDCPYSNLHARLPIFQPARTTAHIPTCTHDCPYSNLHA